MKIVEQRESKQGLLRNRGHAFVNLSCHVANPPKVTKGE